MDAKLVRKLGTSLLVEHSYKLQVTFTDRGRTSTQGSYQTAHWEAQGNQYVIDFQVLPLKRCDLVLGIQLLLSLDPIFFGILTPSLCRFPIRDILAPCRTFYLGKSRL